MIQSNEKERLHALHQLNLLDTDSSEAFDRITRMASHLFDVPVSLVTLLDEDRQWFKSRVGTEIRETPIGLSFCTHAIKSEDVMVVEDMTRDSRFLANPLVSGQENIRFYAGAPLITREGYGLGTICVLDRKPRLFSEQDRNFLSDLAAMAMTQIDLQHAVGHVDSFSGLPNRNQLYEDMDDLARGHPDQSRWMVVVDVISMSRIGQILHVLGSSHFDALIRNSAQILRDLLEQKQKIYHADTARYVVILPDGDEQAYQDLAIGLKRRFRQPVVCDGIPVDVNPGIGLVRFKLGREKPADILRTAIIAALDSREQDQDWSFYDPVSDQTRRRTFTLLSDIRPAISAQPAQFHLVYQPKTDAKTGVCIGAEALLRWTHPKLGNISPAEFIPLVEQTALVRGVTAWVIDAAIAQIVQWKSRGLHVPISINVSAANLEEPDFASRLKSVMDENGIDAHDIELEFTESAVMKNGEGILRQLHAIDEMGVEIAIDDFGTGYSNHAYLQQIPAKTVKLDQSMIRPLGDSERDRMVVRSMIALAHLLDYRVVAEGVETQDILDWLKAQGCDQIQGYLIAKPMEPAAFEQWVMKNRAAA